MTRPPARSGLRWPPSPSLRQRAQGEVKSQTCGGPGTVPSSHGNDAADAKAQRGQGTCLRPPSQQAQSWNVNAGRWASLTPSPAPPCATTRQAQGSHGLAPLESRQPGGQTPPCPATPGCPLRWEWREWALVHLVIWNCVIMPEMGQDRGFWHPVCDTPLCELTARCVKARDSAGRGAAWCGGQWPGHGTGWPWTTRGQGTSWPPHPGRGSRSLLVRSGRPG